MDAKFRVESLIAWLSKHRPESVSERTGNVSPSWLAARTGKSPSYWSDVLRIVDGFDKKFGAEAARELENTLDIPRYTLEGDAAEAGGEPPLVRPPHAHASRTSGSNVIPSTTWDALMIGVPSTMFELALRDNALGREHPAGARRIWQPGRAATAGAIVLVKDAQGGIHARMVQEIKGPARVRYVALQPGFADYEAAEVTPIAVCVGELYAGI
jgi:hypothetical protein